MLLGLVYYMRLIERLYNYTVTTDSTKCVFHKEESIMLLKKFVVVYSLTFVSLGISIWLIK